MRRTFVLFGAGVALGAVVMYFVRDDGVDSAAPSSAFASSDASETQDAADGAPRPIDFLTLATGSVSVTERAALFRLAAEADRSTLEDTIAQVAALPDLEGRRLGEPSVQFWHPVDSGYASRRPLLGHAVA